MAIFYTPFMIQRHAESIKKIVGAIWDLVQLPQWRWTASDGHAGDGVPRDGGEPRAGSDGGGAPSRGG